MSACVRVSAVVPAHNAARTIDQVLAALVRQTRPPDELLVVDDGSRDGTAAAARAANARLVRHARNLGLAAARNTALREARGEIVAYFDADAVPDPSALHHLLTGYDTDARLAAVGGQVVEVGTARLPDRWRALFWRQTQGELRLADAPFVVGACCSLRRSVALAVGGFSPTFRTNGEDVELSARLRRAGWRLAYEPAARVSHLRRDSVASLVAMVYRHSRDHVRALRLHDEPWSHVVANALRWGPVTIVSSLRRHRSAALAALSPLCYGASLAGCGRALLARGRAGHT